VATFFPTSFRKRDPFNGAIAAHTNGAAEEGITCHLPRNTTAVELEDNFVTRHFTQIGAISQSFFVHPNFSKANFANELRPATPVEIENRYWLFGRIAQLCYCEKSGEMIPRRYRELTRAHENSGTIFHCPIPVLVLDRIGRGKILDPVIAKEAKEVGNLRRARDAAIRCAHDSDKASESCRIAQLLCYVVRARLFQNHHSFTFRFFQFRQGALASAKIAAQEEQYRPSARDRALEVAKNGTVRASRIRMKIHRRMLVSRRAPVFSKMLLLIAPGWIQHRQPKIFRVR